MSSYDDVRAAFDRGDFGEIRRLLEPLASAGDLEAQTALGSFLTLGTCGVDSPLDPLVFREGMDWLKQAADAGYGHAAHNLASMLISGGPGYAADRAEARRYMQVAYDTGFEATVAPLSPGSSAGPSAARD